VERADDRCCAGPAARLVVDFLSVRVHACSSFHYLRRQIFGKRWALLIFSPVVQLTRQATLVST